MPTSPLRIEARDPGFTLLEMLVILVVLGIAATIAATALSRKPGAVERDRVAERIRGAILSAQAQAFDAGKPQRVMLAPLAGAGEKIGVAGGVDPNIGTLVVWPDGSVSGGTIVMDGRPLLTVSWLTGTSTGAR